MEVGLLLVFQNWHEDETDADVYREELNLGVRAEELGYDWLWATEHHFDDYSMCPDTTQVLSYLAARTDRIKLGSGGIIVPWWKDPMRLVEKITLLDHLCDGRFMLGLGRGLAKMEYEGFDLDMNEARGRFDEAAAMILEGLETGVVEHSGEYFHQPRVEIRPAPTRSFKDRLYTIAMSPDSADVAGDLGGTFMTFVQGPIENHVPLIDQWRERYRSKQGAEPPPPVLTDFTYCHEDPEEAERVAREYLSRYFLSVIKHYDFAGSHWRETRGYEAYQQGADMIREAGMEAAGAGFADAQLWGTPEQMIEKYRARLEVVGPFNSLQVVSYAGMPFDTVNDSLRLLGEKVLPEVQKMGVTAAAA